MANTQPELTIVVGVELDDTGHTAFMRAAEIALAGANARIHLCHCHGKETEDPARAAELLSVGERLLDHWALQRLYRHPLIARTETHVGIGDPATVLKQLAVDVKADFIVLGTHDKTAFERTTKGSVVRDILRDPPCTVVIARNKDYAEREASPTIDAEHLAQTEERTLRGSHTYSYRRAVPIDFGQGAASDGFVPGG